VANEGVCHGSGSRASRGLRGGATARAGEALCGRRPDATVVGAGGDLRGRVANRGGVGLQTVRDWVLAFNTEGPDGLINGKAPGNASLLDDEQRQALARIVESGPIPAAHGWYAGG
jgi:transposase